MNKNFSFVQESANEQTPRETLDVLIYESAGDMNKIMHYITRYPKERNGHIGELKKATAQSVSMLRMFCEQQGWNFDEVLTLGERDYLDKMQDLRKYGLQESLKKRDSRGE